MFAATVIYYTTKVVDISKTATAWTYHHYTVWLKILWCECFSYKNHMLS